MALFGSGDTGWRLQAEELHSIRGELSQIKAQVDSLLESLDCIDQRREHFTGSKESEKKRAKPGTEPRSPVGEGSLELQGKEGMGADGDSDLRNIDSAEESTDTEEMVKTHVGPQGEPVAGLGCRGLPVRPALPSLCS